MAPLNIGSSSVSRSISAAGSRVGRSSANGHRVSVAARTGAGEKVGRWTIEETLGEGGFSKVSRGVSAFDEPPQHAAIKRALPDSADVDWVLREARITRMLHGHRNVVKVLDAARAADGQPFVAFELLGEDLNAHLRQGPLPPPQLLDLVDDVGSALEAGARLGIRHGDINPSNIAKATSADQRVPDHERAPWKVFDYQFAQHGSKDPSRTETEDAVVRFGTPGYMAPEYWEEGPLGPPADAFALSATVYKAATNMLAFPGESTAERAYNARYQQPVRPTDLNPDLPPSFDSVMAVGLAKRPDERLTVPELRTELRKTFDGIPSPELEARAATVLDGQSWSTLDELAGEDDGRAFQSVDSDEHWWA